MIHCIKNLKISRRTWSFNYFTYSNLMFIIDNWLVGQLKKFLMLRQKIWLKLRIWLVTSSSSLRLHFFTIDYPLGSSLRELTKKCLVKTFFFFFIQYNHFWSFKFLRQIDLKRKKKSNDLISEKWPMLTHSNCLWNNCLIWIDHMFDPAVIWQSFS